MRSGTEAEPVRGLITSNYLANLTQYFVARAMIHFGQGAGAEAPVSQSCQLLPSVNFKLNPLSLSWTTEGVQKTWITQCPRPTSQVERIQHGQPRGSFWSAASNEDYPAMSAKPHEPSGINERLSCDHKTAFSLEPVEPPQGMQRT